LVFEDLEQNGILEHGEQGALIVDVDAFKESLRSFFHNPRLMLRRYPDFSPEQPRRFLSFVFQGVDVVSKEDADRAKRTGEHLVPKPLLYEPESRAAAFDPEAIREAEFHTGPWEILRRRPVRNPSLPTLSGEDVDYREASIAALIYHPQYGGGYRDPENGKLMVWWPSRSEFRPISVNWFDREMGEDFAADRSGHSSLRSPGGFLPEFAPDLVKNGLLTPEDFQTKSGRDAIEGLRQSRRIGRKGRVMLGSVEYFFGRGKETMEELEHSEAFPVGPSIGVMIQEDPETQRRHLTNTFAMFQQGDPRLKRHSVSKGGVEIHRVNQQDANLQPYDSRTFHRKAEGETVEAFEARVEMVENFEYLLRIADRIRSQNGPDLLKLDYDPLTLISATTRAVNSNQAGFVRFVRDYGLNGLRSVVGFDGDEKATRALYKLGDELLPKLAHQVFARIGRIANAVTLVMKRVDELLPEGQSVGSEDAKKIREQLLHRGGDILTRLTQELTATDPTDASVESRIAEEMEKIEAPLLVLASTYKVLHDEKKEVALEDLRDVSLEVVSGADLSRIDRRQMMKIANENWSQYPKLQRPITGGLEGAFERSDNRFYIVRYHGELLGFMRFDPIDEERVYAGSLNIRPELRGSAIGDRILKTAMADESQDHRIEATAYPHLPIAERYLGDYGFTVPRMLANYEGTGETFFQMEIDASTASAYEYFKTSTADLKSQAVSEVPKSADRFVLQFNLHRDYNAFIRTCDRILSPGTMVMTAYRRDRKEPGVVWVGFERKPKQMKRMEKMAA
jgi:hypothetical protein